MKKKLSIAGLSLLLGISVAGESAFAQENATSLKDWFAQGDVGGSLKSYYYTQSFDGAGKNDSEIWVNGGDLRYNTASFYGVQLGAEFQAAFVGHIDDEDGVTAGSMDAEGAVLSEAYLQYELYNTRFKGGRQHYVSPLVANSGSRLIKESFEMYSLSNTDIPDTEVTLGWVNKYQTRTDRSSYADNYFVEYDTNGTGDPGDFYDVGDNGMWILYLKNSSVKGLDIQGQYGNVVDEVQGFYADAKYTFDMALKPFVAAQYYYSDWDDSSKESNDLIGFNIGATYLGVDVFAGFTAAGGDEGDERVFRGLGQGAYYNYTTTTKTAGAGAFEADTDAWQVGTGYTYAGFSGKLRFTSFDNPADNADLDEWTLNLLYKFEGMLENLSVAVDFSILDYEDGEKDATDLRSRLIYSF
ncbi:hypothetical protein [Desulfogranum japonicum]|uniref:hypothetical protein n=1 Tax=Desulfogranum japonicum TaxID=231447 RepID=UPI00041B116E|nr:hypothetical protein [Desulfogranum japonicum]